jgi:hypothetical protein
MSLSAGLARANEREGAVPGQRDGAFGRLVDEDARRGVGRRGDQIILTFSAWGPF